MQAFAEGPDISPSFLVNSFPWASLGSGVVVDVGGSQGSTSIAIAEANPALRFVVQDRPNVIEAAKQNELPVHLASRIAFMAHDFFTEQPVTGDVYLFRYIFHNWADAYVIQILRSLINALKPGARVVIHDNLLPEPNTASPTMEREARYVFPKTCFAVCAGYTDLEGLPIWSCLPYATHVDEIETTGT